MHCSLAENQLSASDLYQSVSGQNLISLLSQIEKGAIVAQIGICSKPDLAIAGRVASVCMSAVQLIHRHINGGGEVE